MQICRHVHIHVHVYYRNAKPCRVLIMTMIVCFPLNVWFCKSTETTTWCACAGNLTPQSFQHTCVYSCMVHVYEPGDEAIIIIVLTTEVRQHVNVHTHMYIVIIYLLSCILIGWCVPDGYISVVLFCMSHRQCT